MNAADAAKYISTFVKATLPKDREKLFNILTLANDRAWKEGKWWGMTKQFFCQVGEDNSIVTPPGYNVLLKVNLDTKPKAIRDEFHQFHRNGTGSITECCGKNWCGDVHDLGEQPVFIQPYNDPSCPCPPSSAPCVRLAFKAVGCEDEPVEVTVKGYYPNEKTHNKAEFCPDQRVYTYDKSTEPNRTELCGCRLSDKATTTVEVKDGATVTVDEDFQILDLFWGRIESITKTKSKTPIEVYAVYSDNKVRLLARLEPWQTRSVYRKYRLPDSCRTACVHAMFKVSEPIALCGDSQDLLITDREAILLLAKGVNMTYYENDDENGERFILRGLKALDGQLKEQESNSETTIQVDGPVTQAADAAEAFADY